MKIVILFAKAGGGHESCAKAIKAQIENQNLEIIQSKNCSKNQIEFQNQSQTEFQSEKNLLKPKQIEPKNFDFSQNNWQKEKNNLKIQEKSFESENQKVNEKIEKQVENSEKAFESCGKNYYSKVTELSKKNEPIEVELIDILGQSPKWQQKLFCQSYVFLTEQTPLLWSFLQILWKWDFLARLTAIPLKIQVWPQLKTVIQKKPDKIICTYFLVDNWLEEIQNQEKSGAENTLKSINYQKNKIPSNQNSNLDQNSNRINSQNSETFLQKFQNLTASFKRKIPNSNFQKISNKNFKETSVLVNNFEIETWKNQDRLVKNTNFDEIQNTTNTTNFNCKNSEIQSEVQNQIQRKSENQPSIGSLKVFTKIPIWTIITDIFSPHSVWFVAKNCQYVVFSKSAKEIAKNRKIPEANIVELTPFFNPKFEQNPSELEIRNWKTEFISNTVLKKELTVLEKINPEKLKNLQKITKKNKNLTNLIKIKNQENLKSKTKLNFENIQKIVNPIISNSTGKILQKFQENSPKISKYHQKFQLNFISKNCKFIPNFTKKTETLENQKLENQTKIIQKIEFKNHQNLQNEKLENEISKINFVNCPTLLVVGGGESMPGGLQILEEILKITLSFNLIFVCGRNEKLKKNCEQIVQEFQKNGNQKTNLQKIIQENPKNNFSSSDSNSNSSFNSSSDLANFTKQKSEKNIQIHGFSTKLFEFINIADIVICKAGPATILECTSQKKPVIISHFIWEQEIGNRGFILQNKLGFYEPKPKKLAQKVYNLLTNSGEIEEIKQNYQKIKLKNGLSKLVEFIIQK